MHCLIPYTIRHKVFYRYQKTSLSEKGFISQVRIKFVLIIHAHYHLQNSISLNFLYMQK